MKTTNSQFERFNSAMDKVQRSDEYCSLFRSTMETRARIPSGLDLLMGRRTLNDAAPAIKAHAIARAGLRKFLDCVADRMAKGENM